MIRTFVLAAALALSLAAPSRSSAFWPYAPYGAYNYGWGWNHATDYVPAPPYFAVHPPVYYSPHITARHYGASPHAWLPGMQPITYVPDLLPARRVTTATSQASLLASHAPAKPVMIENPHVGAKTAAANVDVAPHPQQVENPYFASR